MSKTVIKQDPSSSTLISRRSLIKGLASLSAAALCAPAVIVPKLSSPSVSTLTHQGGEKRLSFYNIHTGEYLKNCTFWAEGKFNTEGLQDINNLFRDYRTGDVHEIDHDLVQLLHRVAHELDTTEVIHLISGYRSPRTNNLLASKSRGVAKHSQHLQGKAADIVIPGRTLKQIQKVAQAMRVGGVGRYRDFVHLDTGRVRYWGLA